MTQSYIKRTPINVDRRYGKTSLAGIRMSDGQVVITTPAPDRMAYYTPPSNLNRHARRRNRALKETQHGQG